MVVRHARPGADVRPIIAYALECWEMLDSYGYGAVRKKEDRAHENYYGKLEGTLKIGFDKFWRKFKKPNDKQRAALSWIKLFKATPQAEWESLIDDICFGADKEAQTRQSRDTTPPMAELWLNRRRWEDWPREVVTKADESRSKLGLLAGELAHAERMNKIQPGGIWESEIEKIKARIEGVKK